MLLLTCAARVSSDVPLTALQFVTHLLHLKTHNYSANRALLHRYALSPPVAGEKHFGFHQVASASPAPAFPLPPAPHDPPRFSRLVPLRRYTFVTLHVTPKNAEIPCKTCSVTLLHLESNPAGGETLSGSPRHSSLDARHSTLDTRPTVPPSLNSQRSTGSQQGSTRFHKPPQASTR
jgi:hypothetical protein